MINTTIKRLKNCIYIIYNNYFIYENIKYRLKMFPHYNLFLIEQIILHFKKLEFSKIFTILNLLINLNIILEYIINTLIYIKNFDIEQFIEYIEFYITFLINYYYYKKSSLYLAYECVHDEKKMNMYIKHFLIKQEHNTEISSFIVNMVGLLFFYCVFGPIFFVIVKDLEKYNTLENIVFYFSSSSLFQL